MTPKQAITMLNNIRLSGDWPLAPFVLRDLLETLGYTDVVAADDEATVAEKPEKSAKPKAKPKAD